MKTVRYILTPDRLEVVNKYFNEIAGSTNGLPVKYEAMKSRIDLVANLQSAAEISPLSAGDAATLRDNEGQAFSDVTRLAAVMRAAERNIASKPKEDFERPDNHRFYGDNHSQCSYDRGR